MMFDLTPATDRMAALVAGVRDELLHCPTPCEDMSLGTLLDHVGGLAVAFAQAAAKQETPLTAQPPAPDGSRLGAGWRERIGDDLRRLAVAWQDPAAWTGTTRAGGVQLAAAEAAVVALDELVIHGWDVARASGQAYEPDPVQLYVVYEFVREAAEPGQEAAREGLFGPVVPVPDDAPLLDRVIALSGRRPDWSSPLLTG